MDLSKAFDTLNHTILLNKLMHYGVAERELDWFKSYLSDRFQYVFHNNKSSSLQKISTGVPQGSILGPLLFLIYVNDLVKATDLNVIQYADDTCITIPFKYTSNQNGLELSSTVINDKLNIIYSWLAANKLSLNLSKTKYTLFHFQQKKIDILPNIQIDKTKISNVRSYKFLGIVIDENLNWDCHKTYLSNKLSKTVGLLSKLKHFFPKYILLKMYNSLILSNITYGITCWAFGNCSRIEILQKKAIRNINKSPYNSHTKPICKESNILLFKDLIDLATLKFFHKFINKNLPTYFQGNSFLKCYTPFRVNLRNTKPIHFEHFVTESVNFRPKYFIPRNNKSSSDSRLSIYLATSLNKDYFPKCIIEKVTTHSINGLSCYFKKYVIDNYNALCQDLNCFICRSRD